MSNHYCPTHRVPMVERPSNLQTTEQRWCGTAGALDAKESSEAGSAVCMSPAKTAAVRPEYAPDPKSIIERVAALRERAAAVGLKRLELYAHPEDWVAIKALADKLKKRREKAAKVADNADVTGLAPGKDDK